MSKSESLHELRSEYINAQKTLFQVCVHEGERIADAGDLFDVHEAELQTICHYYSELVYADYSGAKQLLADLEKQEKSFCQWLNQLQMNHSALSEFLRLTQKFVAEKPNAKSVSDLTDKLPETRYKINVIKKSIQRDTAGHLSISQRQYYEIKGIGPHSTLATGVFSISALANLPLAVFCDEIEEEIAANENAMKYEKALLILCESRAFLLTEILESYVRKGFIHLNFVDLAEKAILQSTLWADRAKNPIELFEYLARQLEVTGKSVKDVWKDAVVELEKRGLPARYKDYKSLRSAGYNYGFKLKKRGD